MNEWIKKMWRTHTNTHTHTHAGTHNGILLSPKKGRNNTIYSNMLDLEIIIISEVTQRETNII